MDITFIQKNRTQVNKQTNKQKTKQKSKNKKKQEKKTTKRKKFTSVMSDHIFVLSDQNSDSAGHFQKKKYTSLQI